MLESILDVCCLCRREKESSQLMLSPIFGGIFDKKHSRSWLAGMFIAWKETPLVGCGKLMWKINPFSIPWSIWKERNNKMFSRIELTWESLVLVVALRILKWAS